MARAGAFSMLGVGFGVASALVVGLGLCPGVGRARAERRSPGCSTASESWKSPGITREREAAGQIAPKGLDLTPAVPSRR